MVAHAAHFDQLSQGDKVAFVYHGKSRQGKVHKIRSNGFLGNRVGTLTISYPGRLGADRYKSFLSGKMSQLQILH